MHHGAVITKMSLEYRDYSLVTQPPEYACRHCDINSGLFFGIVYCYLRD